MKKRLFSIVMLFALILVSVMASDSVLLEGRDGPLGEWPDFTPSKFITAQDPNNPDLQTYLYGDWGAIVGEEALYIQDDELILFYHSYHATYLTRRSLGLDINGDWALGYDPVTHVKYTPLAEPGGSIPGSAYQHTDTPAYIQHPVTGEHLLYNTVRPGTKDKNPDWVGIPGRESSIQVAVSEDPPEIGIPFYQNYTDALWAELWWERGFNNDGEIRGGLSEPSAVWVPHLNCVRLFYRGLTGASGSYWNWRISYADSVDGKSGWVKNTVPTFDPSDPSNPAYQWTQQFGFRGAWQAQCVGDPRADGVHMVMTVSNQNYAVGGRIAYYWSPDWGDTWIGHPDNPIIVAGTHPDGVPATGFQRTPCLVIDDTYNRYILAYNGGHDINERWRRRTHLAIASRPPVCIHHGDVDFNGSVTAGDAQLAFQIALGSYTPGYEEECAGDCNGDSNVTAGDAQQIFFAVLGSGSCADPL